MVAYWYSARQHFPGGIDRLALDLGLMEGIYPVYELMIPVEECIICAFLHLLSS